MKWNHFRNSSSKINAGFVVLPVYFLQDYSAHFVTPGGGTLRFNKHCGAAIFFRAVGTGLCGFKIDEALARAFKASTSIKGSIRTLHFPIY